MNEVKKVFLIVREEYEGDIIDGVYDSLEKAEQDLEKSIEFNNSRIPTNNLYKRDGLFKKDEQDVFHNDNTLVSYSNSSDTIQIIWMELNKSYGRITENYDHNYLL